MDKFKEKLKNLTKSQIACIIISLVIIIVAISVAICFSISNKKSETLAFKNETVSTITTTAQVTQSTTQTTTQTTTQKATEVTTLTPAQSKKKYKANPNIKVSVATGNKEKDEDKGNEHKGDSSLDGNDSSNNKPTIPNHQNGGVAPHTDNNPKPVPTTQPQTKPSSTETSTSHSTTNSETKPSTSDSTKPDDNKVPQYDYSKLERFQSKYTKYFLENTSGYSGWKIINNTRYYFDNKTHKPLTNWQTIGNNKRYYFNSKGANASKLGIDVSRYNNQIDWNKVRNSGVDFAIIRVGFTGYGKSHPQQQIKLDNNVEQNIKGATAAGIPVGLYWFTQAINENEAIAEASACIKIAKKYKISYPIYIDIEYSGSHDKNGKPDNQGRADGLNKYQRTQNAIAFCETIKNAGYTPGIYASRDYIYKNLVYENLSKYQIWLAHYTNSETNFKYHYDTWQYTSSGNIDGISGRVDMNVSLYDYSNKGRNKIDLSKNGNNIILTDKSTLIKCKEAEDSITNFKNGLISKNDALSKIDILPNNDYKSLLKKAL